MSLREALQKKVKGKLTVAGDLPFLERVSTGIASLDIALGGGLPLRRATQIYGDSSAGKTALSLAIISHVLREDPNAECFLADSEGTITKQDIEDLHIDQERFIVYNGVGGEDIVDTTLEALEAGAKVAVIDSIPFLRPRKVLEEINKNSEYRDVSGIAALLERVQFKIVNALQHSNGVLIMINQQRPPKSMYEAPGYPGGSALTFMLSANIHITSAKKERDNAEFITQNILVRKNKTFIPMTRAEIPMLKRIPCYGQCLLSAGVNSGLVIAKGGGNYELTPPIATALNVETKLGKGAEHVGHLLWENKELYKGLYTLVLEHGCNQVAFDMEEAS